MTTRPDWREAWDVVRADLEGKDPPVSDEWLRHLHASAVERFLSDNQRIWSTASILVPISLAAFPAFFALDRREWAYSASFAVFSIGVMCFWTVVAERHRAFQQRAANTFQFIEEYVLDEATAVQMRTAASVGAPDPSLSVRAARLGLLAMTTGLWIVIIVLSAVDALPVSTE